MITIENLSKKFGEITAVDGISLEVTPGEMFGLIGPDGAGKTTTIRILCTLMMPDQGQCRVKNFDVVREYRQIREIIGYMPQRFSLYPDLTVAENIKFFADLFQVPSELREPKMQQLLQFSRMAPFQKRRASALSGGMKQKLALTCTLIHTPEILFLDEPTTGVDPVSRREFWQILRSLRDQGVTIFYTTPYMDEALRCDRVAFMHRGKILACDRPEKIVRLFPYDLLEIAGEGVIHAGPLLQSMAGVRSIQIFGDKLHLALPPGEKIPEIQHTLAAHGIGPVEIRPIQPGIEDTFIELMQN